jgi:hypothetical protein
MKKLSLLVLIAITAIIFFGCSKSKTSPATAASSTEWTLNGTTYKGLVTTYNDTTTGLGILVSVDPAGNYLSVIFYSHPAANGTYTVTNGGVTSLDNTDCQIECGVYTGSASDIYTSTGKTGDQLNLSISGGKLKVSFTNITVAYNQTITTVSGTALQQ